MSEWPIVLIVAAVAGAVVFVTSYIRSAFSSFSGPATKVVAMSLAYLAWAMILGCNLFRRYDGSNDFFSTTIHFYAFSLGASMIYLLGWIAWAHFHRPHSTIDRQGYRRSPRRKRYINSFEVCGIALIVSLSLQAYKEGISAALSSTPVKLLSALVAAAILGGLIWARDRHRSMAHSVPEQRR